MAEVLVVIGAISSVIAIFSACDKKLREIRANSDAATRINEDLQVVLALLQKLDTGDEELMIYLSKLVGKLDVLSKRIKYLFDESIKGRHRVLVKNVLISSSIKAEFDKLDTELLKVLGMFNLAMSIFYKKEVMMTSVFDFDMDDDYSIEDYYVSIEN